MTGALERTRALLSPLVVDDVRPGRWRQRLSSGIAPLVEHVGPGDPVLVTLPLLRRARSHPESLSAPEEPFAWKPVFVRRSLGLAVVEACVAGRFRTPAEAAGPVAEQAVAEWERTGWRTFHWEPWFAALGAGARATVLADAVCWATSLWSSFQWGALPVSPQIGGADDQWICPGDRVVRLKGRSEMRVQLPGPPQVPLAQPRPAPLVALVSVAGGCPGSAWSEELAYLALVATVRSPSRSVPVRVMGLWPDAGLHAVIEVDDDALAAAVERVLATVAAVTGLRTAPAPPCRQACLPR